MGSCGCLVVEKVEDHDARGKGTTRGRAGCVCGSCAGERRFETMFPIYVMGSSPARGLLDSAAGDPIWEAVKSEARSEVSTVQAIVLPYMDQQICLRCLDSKSPIFCLCGSR
jgi:hypothetical protein